MSEVENSAIKESVSRFINSLSLADREILLEYIRIPDEPGAALRWMPLVIKYGPRFREISDKVQDMREELLISFDSIREIILQQLTD